MLDDVSRVCVAGNTTKRVLSQVQFSCAGVLGIRALFVGCDFPLWMQYALVAYMCSFIVLFGRFYIQSYRKKVIL